MVLFSKKFTWFWFLVFALVFSAQVVPRIYQEAPTNDEPIELTNGYFYWQGDVVTHNHHPPLPKMLQALPLHFMGLNDSVPSGLKDIQSRAVAFFFELNQPRVEEMVHGGRFVSLLFGLAIGWVLFLCVREKSFIVLFSTLFLWAFHPTFLAFSGLCLADLPATLFFFLSVLLFQKHLERPGPTWAFLAGGMAGMAVCAKFSCLALVPLFVILEGACFFNPDRVRLAPWDRIKDWLLGATGFLLSIGLIYLPGTLLQPDHLNPWSYFLAGLRNMIGYSSFHQPTYFWGLASRKNHLLYFPLDFLLKNTLPFLILLLTALVTGIRREQRFPFWLWFSPLFFFACIVPVQNLGVRYLLPAFPFLILIAAETLGALWEDQWTWLRDFKGKWIVIGLLLWNAATIFLNYPNMIGYANDLIPPKDKPRYLADCDLDMGQDVKKLAEFAKQKGWNHIKLAQFGGAVNLSFYGVPVQNWTERDLLGPQPGYVYVVNVTLFQIGPLWWDSLLPITRCWIAHAPPTGQVGDAWYYFEVPGVPQKDPSPVLHSICDF